MTAPRFGLVSTPTVELNALFPLCAASLRAKLESLQPSGSAKERSASFMIDALESSGALARGGTVVESTSGNLGVALARQCAVRGHRFIAVLDDRTNPATRRVMELFGAETEVVDPGPEGNRLKARVQRRAELLAEIEGAVSTDQYSSEANPQAHRLTSMPELAASLGGPPDHLYVAVSTLGTLVGAQRVIAEHGWGTRLVAVDSDSSALFGGRSGERLLPGLGAGITLPFEQEAAPDAVVRVAETDMIRGCRLLARREGILAGASTGAVVAAVGRDAAAFGPGERVAMLVHDNGTPYLSTVFDDDWVRAHMDDPGRALKVDDEPWPFGVAESVA